MLSPRTLPSLRRGLAVAMLAFPTASASGAVSNLYQRADDKLHYQSCLALAARDPKAALADAQAWERSNGGAPAGHCEAVALVGLKQYPQAAVKLDTLGRAPGMGGLRASLFDQAGNAWLLAGNAAKAVASFQAALALSAGDADLYADLARAQAVLAAWPAVENDLNAALGMAPWRADLLVLRANARQAQGKLKEAAADADAAVKLAPRSAEALMERGSVRRDAGDLGGARADFEKALAIRPAGRTADDARRNIAALDAAVKKTQQKPPRKK